MLIMAMEYYYLLSEQKKLTEKLSEETIALKEQQKLTNALLEDLLSVLTQDPYSPK